MTEGPERRTDYTSLSTIVGALITYGIILIAVPPLLILSPLAIIALVILYKMSEGNERQAQALARKHLGATTKSKLDIVLSPGLYDGLALNDWGIVFVTPRKRPVELSWKDITSVDEPEVGKLAIEGRSGAFRVDLQHNYFLRVAKAIQEAIPNRTSFLCDPLTGQSNLFTHLRRQPMSWRGRWGTLNLADSGIELGGKRLSWAQIESAAESLYADGENEANHFHELTVSGAGQSFVISSPWFCEPPQVDDTGYDVIKMALAEKIPGRTRFVRRAPTAARRAEEEFEFGRETTAAALSVALENGRTTYVEPHFKHMLWLLDTFPIAGDIDARAFLSDYADLLERGGRHDEAKKLRGRAAAV